MYCTLGSHVGCTALLAAMWDVLHSWQPCGMYCTLGSHVGCTALLVAMCTVKRFRLLQSYFGYLSCIPFVYIHDTKFKGCLEFEQNVVEKLPC